MNFVILMLCQRIALYPRKRCDLKLLRPGEITADKSSSSNGSDERKCPGPGHGLVVRINR